jgi:hypothetical protein
MEIKKKEKNWVWHWVPYCCAETINNNNILKGKNFLWLNWLWIFR